MAATGVPVLLPDFATAESLRRQPQVAEAQRRWNQLTKAVVAVGSWDPPQSQLHVAVSQRERESLRAQGACAELCANLLDADGRPVAVGDGHDKMAAFRAVLKGGHATSVVTNVSVARGLLTQPAP